MIVIAFAFFAALILAWLAAPEGSVSRVTAPSMAAATRAADPEVAGLTAGAD